MLCLSIYLSISFLSNIHLRNNLGEEGTKVESAEVSPEDSAKIAQLMALGFSEIQSKAALLQAAGDADMAATLLMSQL